MPLKNGYSRKTVADNIAMMVKEGYPQKNAIAASLDHARKCYRKKFPSGFLPSYLKEKDGSRHAKYKENPSVSVEKQLDSAMKLYRNFSGHEPELVGKVEKPNIPAVGLVIGELEGVAYEATRDGVSEKYFHRFDKPVRPLLVSSFDGRLIYILGGEYDFTEDGIVDATDKKFSPRFK